MAGVRAVFESVKSLIAQHRIHRAAISAAVTAFRLNSDERPSKSMTVVVASDDDRLIVRVCFGTTRPPRRAWFAVALRDLATTPLTFDEVKEVYDVPIWR